MECHPLPPLYPASYFDTVTMLLRRRVKYGELMRQLRPLCLGKVFPGPTKLLGWRKLTMHQPTDAAIERLVRLPLEAAKLQRVDVALDLLVANRHDRDRLAEWITPRLVQRWNRHERRATRGTTYTGPGRWRMKTLAVYGDKPCRVDGTTDCVHIEVRAKGTGQVKALGWETPADLLATDWHGLWKRLLSLKEPDPHAMRRQYRRRHPAATEDLARRRVGLLLRACQTAATPAAQDLTQWCRALPWLDSRTALRDLNTEAFLPPA